MQNGAHTVVLIKKMGRMNERMCIESPAHGTCSMDVTVTTPTATAAAAALEPITASKYRHESGFALRDSGLRPEEAVQRAGSRCPWLGPGCVLRWAGTSW